MWKWLNGLAFVFSVIALAVALWVYHESDARADAALKRREKALVDKHRPAVEHLCREFGLKDRPSPDAETLDELMRPLGSLFQGLGK